MNENINQRQETELIRNFPLIIENFFYPHDEYLYHKLLNDFYGIIRGTGKLKSLEVSSLEVFNLF